MAKTYLTANIDRSPAPETLSRHITAPLAMPGKRQGRTLLNLVEMLREEAAAGKLSAIDALDQVEALMNRRAAARQALAA